MTLQDHSPAAQQVMLPCPPPSLDEVVHLARAVNYVADLVPDRLDESRQTNPNEVRELERRVYRVLYFLLWATYDMAHAVLNDMVKEPDRSGLEWLLSLLITLKELRAGFSKTKIVPGKWETRHTPAKEVLKWLSSKIGALQDEALSGLGLPAFRIMHISALIGFWIIAERVAISKDSAAFMRCQVNYWTKVYNLERLGPTKGLITNAAIPPDPPHRRSRKQQAPRSFKRKYQVRFPPPPPSGLNSAKTAAAFTKAPEQGPATAKVYDRPDTPDPRKENYPPLHPLLCPITNPNSEGLCPPPNFTLNKLIQLLACPRPTYNYFLIQILRASKITWHSLPAGLIPDRGMELMKAIESLLPEDAVKEYDALLKKMDGGSLGGWVEIFEMETFIARRFEEVGFGGETKTQPFTISKVSTGVRGWLVSHKGEGWEPWEMDLIRKVWTWRTMVLKAAVVVKIWMEARGIPTKT